MPLATRVRDGETIDPWLAQFRAQVALEAAHKCLAFAETDPFYGDLISKNQTLDPQEVLARLTNAAARQMGTAIKTLENDVGTNKTTPLVRIFAALGDDEASLILKRYLQKIDELRDVKSDTNPRSWIQQLNYKRIPKPKDEPDFCQEDEEKTVRYLIRQLSQSLASTGCEAFGQGARTEILSETTEELSKFIIDEVKGLRWHSLVSGQDFRPISFGHVQNNTSPSKQFLNFIIDFCSAGETDLFQEAERENRVLNELRHKFPELFREWANRYLMHHVLDPTDMSQEEWEKTFQESAEDEAKTFEYILDMPHLAGIAFRKANTTISREEIFSAFPRMDGSNVSASIHRGRTDGKYSHLAYSIPIMINGLAASSLFYFPRKQYAVTRRIDALKSRAWNAVRDIHWQGFLLQNKSSLRNLDRDLLQKKTWLRVVEAELADSKAKKIRGAGFFTRRQQARQLAKASQWFDQHGGKQAKNTAGATIGKSRLTTMRTSLTKQVDNIKENLQSFYQENDLQFTGLLLGEKRNGKVGLFLAGNNKPVYPHSGMAPRGASTKYDWRGWTFGDSYKSAVKDTLNKHGLSPSKFSVDYSEVELAELDRLTDINLSNRIRKMEVEKRADDLRAKVQYEKRKHSLLKARSEIQKSTNSQKPLQNKKGSEISSVSIAEISKKLESLAGEQQRDHELREKCWQAEREFRIWEAQKAAKHHFHGECVSTQRAKVLGYNLKKSAMFGSKTACPRCDKHLEGLGVRRYFVRKNPPPASGQIKNWGVPNAARSGHIRSVRIRAIKVSGKKFRVSSRGKPSMTMRVSAPRMRVR